MKRKTKKKTKNSKRPSITIILPSRTLIISFGASVLFALFSLTLGRHGTFCANSISCIKDLSGKFDPAATTGEYLGKKVTPPPETYLAELEQPSHAILGAATGQKKIYVDLTNQRVYAFQGTTIVYNFIAATGKYYPTPTGVFHIWIKLRATLMAGGNPTLGTSYYLPNVPYTMYFYNDQIPKTSGYALHGEYWLRDDQLGMPQSHGCVNMLIEDAHKIYDWADPPTADNPGTEIDIYGKTPGI